MTTDPKPFRAIIVGGGLVALTAAHIFSRADIDFVILEQHENLLPDIGSLLNLWPPTFRIFDQLGLVDKIEPVLNDVKVSVTMSADDGTIFSELAPDEIIKKNHGYPIKFTHRPLYIEALYQNLSESTKEKIKLKKRVVNVKVFDDGVKVECDDGTVEEGSIIIGCDGVHSRVRHCMQTLAEGKPPAKSPFVTTYRMLFGNVPVPPGIQTNFNFECASERISTQLVTGNHQAWFGIYEALDKPTSERIRYTEEDKQQVVEKWGHLYMAPGLKVRDLYPTHIGDMGLINLEEGEVDNWSWKRIVLVSDTVRKLEPHAGLGYNSGVLDVVVLVNKLKELLGNEPSPSTEALEAAFAEYQKERKEVEPGFQSMSKRRARSIAWLTPMNKIMAKYVAPWTHLAYYALYYIYAPFVSRMPVIEWLPEKPLSPPPEVPYLYQPTPDGTGKGSLKRAARNSAYGLSIYTGAITLAALTAVGFRYYRRI
ncbi:hypothetical protein M426DRAFT_24548 [Hypoxylon sp. CI-4A]|nr:hypothetical protein M426DRAFT_24548 [Hypoxylon sp. CI-4A]